MVKIPTLFERDPATKLVIPSVRAGCEWVAEGKGFGTIKIDGVNVKIQIVEGQPKLYRRLKPSQDTEVEAAYIPCHPQDDEHLFKALANSGDRSAGIFEAYGPGINGNPQHAEDLGMVRLIPVAGFLMISNNVSPIRRGPSVTVQEMYDSIRAELEISEVEGIVFHLENPAMNPIKFAKIKRKDFGLSWPIQEVQMP